MSGKPTLYKTGAVIPQPWMTAQIRAKAETQPAIDFVVDYILDRIPITKRANPKIAAKSPGDMILLLKSGTGSGKSTALAPAIYTKQECSIVITQPRVLTTVEIVHDIVRRNSEFNLGDNIGYQTGVIKRKPIKRKGINFMTTGVLLQQFITKGIEWVTTTYAVIFIDEVHERSIEVELLLYFIKLMTIDHWNQKYPLVVLMSATFNEALYYKYFDIPKNNFIEVMGFTHPITEIWQKHDVQNYLTRTVNLVKQIHQSNTADYKHAQRDIIIFVKGAADIKFLLDAIWKLNEDANLVSAAGYIYPLGLNREIFIESGKRYQDIMAQLDTVKMTFGATTAEEEKVKPTAKPIASSIKVSRRVIVATNVAETGVTIDTLKHCIDTGYFMNVWTDSVFDTEVIMACPVTRFMVLQRKGRVGRKAPGIWYPMYTKEIYDALPIDQPSKLITEEISIPLLNLIITGTASTFAEEPRPQQCDPDDLYEIYLDEGERYTVDDQYTQVSVRQPRESGMFRVQSAGGWTPFSLDLIELPSSDSLLNALDKLLALGFVDDNFKPTPLGCLANKIRKVSPDCIRMMFAGYSYGANVLDLITIAAFVEVGWQAVSEVPRFKYQPRSPLPNPSKLSSRVLWGCEFVVFLWIWFVFTEYVNKIAKDSRKNAMTNMIDWCHANGFILQGLLDVTTRRDELIANFITCDMNPFYNGLGLERGTYNLRDIMRNDQEMGINEVRKIKKCLVDGFRYYICSWDRDAFVYRSNYKHIPVIVDSYLTKATTVFDKQMRPSTIVCSGIILRQKFQSDIFEYSPDGAISILDGFVSLDETLLIN